MNEHSGWGSKLTFIFAMMGATIGIGNIWRFSYVFYNNGGGSFFIPYFIAIVVMGIPFLILEYGLGFKFKKSFSKLLHDINPKFEIIAWMLIIFVFIIAIYYMVILSWDFIYFLNSFTFGWGTDPSSFFTSSVGGSSDLMGMESIILPTFIGCIILWVLFWLVSNNDVDKGIGLISRILMPLLFIIMSLILVYSLTLPGFDLGVKTLFTPNWNMLLDINIWLAAFAQIVFSLSMGEAIAYTYASYLSEETRLIDNVFMVVVANSIYEIFVGLGIFSVLGYMSVTHSIPITELITEGTSLIFVVLPEIFDVMGPVGRIMAPLLFLSVLFAGFTSSLALVEPLLSSLCEKLGWSRKKGVTVLVIIACCGSLLFSTGISSYLVEVTDTFVNEFGFLILVALQAIIFTWYFDIDEIIPVLNKNSSIKVGKKWKFTLKYILPLMLIIMWIIGVAQLIYEMDLFKLGIYLLIAVIVLGFSIFFVKVRPNGQDSKE
ncbi:MAG: sodium-dependent transporter [Methanobrevibacter sp.]|nr:sodium-dependent transporter [Methanobrevibacter sp.]